MIRRNYDEKLKLVRVEFSGRIDLLKDLKGHFEALREMEKGLNLRVLLTARDDFELANPLTAEFAALHIENRRAAFKGYESYRTAVVTNESFEAAATAFVSHFLQESPLTLRLFSTEKAAVKWLLSKGD